MADPIKLTIDGKEVEAQPGKTVLQAAMDAGIYIPYLCYFPKMKPYGACRACVVEIESNGRKMTVASCTMPAANDMVVESQNDAISNLRRGVIELLMSEHPHGCLTCHRIELCGPQDICQRHVAVTDRCTTCPKNERCELKDTVRSVELDLRTPLNYHRRNLPIHTDDPFYDRDYNLCIVCARCVRVCDEVRFDTALTLTSRSGVSLVGTSHGTSLLESGCEFCGACIDVCPTGALVERDYKWEKAAKEVTTVCTNCPVGCQMVAEVNKYDKVVRFKGDLAGAANNGQACFRGKFGYDYPNDKSRLKRPYVRDGGVLTNVEWDDAYGRIAEALAKYDPSEVAVIASPRGSNEDNYVAQRFAREVLKTSNVDSALNVVPEVQETLYQRLGTAGATNPIWQLEKAGCILVVSGNPTEEQNVLAVPAKKAARAGAKIIIIDSRETEMTRYASDWLRARPGTESALLAGMAKAILDEAIEHQEFTASRVSTSGEFKQSLWDFDLAKVSRFCGVDETQIRRAARTFATSGTGAILFGVDTVEREQRTELTNAVVNLSLLTGNIGRDHAGVYPLYHGANTLGSFDVGCTPFGTPGEALAKQGMGVAEMFDGMREGKIKAAVLLSDGMNPDAAELGDVAAALGHLEFLAVSAVFDNEATANADVVLPAATYAEQTSTITNLERRVQLVRQLWAPKNGEKPGWQLFSDLASHMGADGFKFDTASQVFDALQRDVAGYAGLSHEKLGEGGVQTPVASPESTGTTVMHAAQGEGLKLPLEPVRFPTEARRSTDDLVLAPGRVLHQPERRVSIARRGRMNYVEREEVVRLHPDDASAVGVKEGERVSISGPDGEPLIEGTVSIDSPHRGLISVTTLFAEIASAMEDSNDPDPSPRLPGLSLKRVKVTKARARRESEVAAD